MKALHSVNRFWICSIFNRGPLQYWSNGHLFCCAKLLARILCCCMWSTDVSSSCCVWQRRRCVHYPWFFFNADKRLLIKRYHSKFITKLTGTWVAYFPYSHQCIYCSAIPCFFQVCLSVSQFFYTMKRKLFDNLNEENKTFKFERHVSATPVPSSVYRWNSIRKLTMAQELPKHVFQNLKVLFSSLRLPQNCCFYVLLKNYVTDSRYELLWFFTNQFTFIYTMYYNWLFALDFNEWQLTWATLSSAITWHNRNLVLVIFF